jgi:energy-coupling factor transporter ATP-binding protein EcfA2
VADSRPTAGRGPLDAAELALAAVMAGLTVVIAIVGSLVPHAGPVGVLGAVPLAIVAQRTRLRALVASAFAAGAVGFIVAGLGPVLVVVVCATVGAVVGDLKRRRRGTPWVVGATFVVAPAFGALAVGFFAVFASARRLTLDQVQIATNGFTGFLRHVSLGSFATWWSHAVDVMLAHWWLTVGLLTAAAVACVMATAWICLGAVLARLAWVSTVNRLALAARGGPEESDHIAPLPVRLSGVSYRYPRADHDALRGIDLTIGSGEFVAVVGPNGSGKSTLARLLAGVPPTGGDVHRPGSTGLGRPGGVALVAQRPESQILGVRVDDDVTWGLPESERPDVASLLATVGLGGMEGRDTSTLSGGELQRLAVAGALAHRPALLVSDESTAMIDPDGSHDLMEVLRRLPSQFSMTVVHVTHREAEAAMADRVIRLEHGSQAPGTAVPAVTRVRARPPIAGEGQRALRPLRDQSRMRGDDLLRCVLRARGLSHTYAPGTPWAQPALRDVDLAIGEADGVLIVGENGSGKTTLAWALAGLLKPTSGVCELDDEPVVRQVGRVALAFQHARLQLQRPTLLSDVRAASGAGRAEAEEALMLVGLDPERFGPRPVEQLSGGQVRRAALAGLLARQPRVLILDEPLAGLDEEGRAGMLELMAGLRREGRTLVVISHDLDELGQVCPTTVELVGGRVVPAPERRPMPALDEVGVT